MATVGHRDHARCRINGKDRVRISTNDGKRQRLTEVRIVDFDSSNHKAIRFGRVDDKILIEEYGRVVDVRNRDIEGVRRRSVKRVDGLDRQRYCSHVRVIRSTCQHTRD